MQILSLITNIKFCINIFVFRFDYEVADNEIQYSRHTLLVTDSNTFARSDTENGVQLQLYKLTMKAQEINEITIKAHTINYLLIIPPPIAH